MAVSSDGLAYYIDWYLPESAEGLAREDDLSNHRAATDDSGRRRSCIPSHPISAGLESERVSLRSMPPANHSAYPPTPAGPTPQTARPSCCIEPAHNRWPSPRRAKRRLDTLNHSPHRRFRPPKRKRRDDSSSTLRLHLHFHGRRRKRAGETP